MLFRLNFSLMTSLTSWEFWCLFPQDEFQTYSRKKVMWICLSALNSTFRLNPDNPFITDEESIINRAIRKPDLKVSTIMAPADAREGESFFLPNTRLNSYIVNTLK